MSTTHIKPTLGRIVWHRGKDGETRPAIVVGVNGTFNLDLFVFGQNSDDDICGHMGHVTHADPEHEPGCLPSWHWMPYQLGQAKKAEKDLSAADALGHDYAAENRRFQALQMALTTPGVIGPRSVLDAAAAYQVHIEGVPAATIETKAYADGSTFTGVAPLPDRSPDGAPALVPHQQRVVDERAELDDKLSKLAGFSGSSLFETLPSAEQRRLRAQAEAMRTYSGILAERIAAFTPATAA